ncbi:sulfotransferase [Paracoccus caeni]|uniref:Sulfotransferase n=1 Tax=Paracoccus caeni TaxID=657651 RepID=A0A934VZU7_9RHOB|nr:sulfotransferase [Paracoccus caeni]
MSAAFDPEGKPRKPGALCIGAQKAGTSWLAQMLGQHPQIWIPPFKEAQYFNHLFLPDHRQWTGWHYRNKLKEIRERHVKRNVPMPPELDAYLVDLTSRRMFHNQWYKRIFAPAPKTAMPMDFTPEYSGLPDEGVDYIHDFMPKARVIYLIRHPVDRAVSQLRMNLRRKKSAPATISEWLTAIEDPVLIERGDYASYLPRWLARFPDMLVLPFGRIARDPAAVMDQVETYLKIGPYPYSGMRNKVFANPEGLHPPPEVIAALEARLQPQLDFLADTIGPEFVEEIR